jgi:hypothetical protein
VVRLRALTLQLVGGTDLPQHQHQDKPLPTRSRFPRFLMVINIAVAIAAQEHVGGVENAERSSRRRHVEQYSPPVGPVGPSRHQCSLANELTSERAYWP